MAQRERSASKYCLQCGYTLDGLTESRCPECGREFDPFNGSSFRRGHDDEERLWLAPRPEEACVIRERLERAGLYAVVDGQEVRVNRVDIDHALQILSKPTDDFRCPLCDTGMTPGYVWISQVSDSFVPSSLVWAAGVPHRAAFKGYQHDHVICSTWRRAHQCPSCARVTIEPADSGRFDIETTSFRTSGHYAIECLACGEQVPEGESRCPKCGWSYGASEPGSESDSSGRE
jgi:predicted RNA-binding Zn-ribbon protein involved in translation (DUF1610 family)